MLKYTANGKLYTVLALYGVTMNTAHAQAIYGVGFRRSYSQRKQLTRKLYTV
jgi:hypothetical protein